MLLRAPAPADSVTGSPARRVPGPRADAGTGYQGRIAVWALITACLPALATACGAGVVGVAVIVSSAPLCWLTVIGPYPGSRITPWKYRRFRWGTRLATAWRPARVLPVTDPPTSALLS
ncbi:hypothetical protein ACTD5D_40915 [Nocardia takedensis]|uniref:hypothetical protein n=1 Tax=Nocardia takedensis TaxID=259390 RepID=UPI003F76CB71